MGGCCSSSNGVGHPAYQAPSTSGGSASRFRRKSSFPSLLAGNPQLCMMDKPFKEEFMARSQFILDNPEKIQKVYDMDGQMLGEGGFGTVSLGTHRLTQAKRAIKKVPKRNIQSAEQLKKEIAVMKVMDHPNIIKLYETFEDHQYVYLVMEMCKGGELFDSVIAAGHFTEAQVAIVMQQILRAVNYMHQNGVVHRDIKPENFLLLTNDPIETNTIKVIDFGLAARCGPNEVLTTKAGTPYYVAPEVLHGRYDRMVDLWAVGVIMYILLCGYPPFQGDTDQEVLRAVLASNWNFRSKEWKPVSNEAKDLIRKLLKVKPTERYAAEPALNHSWIRCQAPKATQLGLQGDVVSKLRHFQSENKLKKAALNIIAGQLSEERISGLRRAFEALDANGDGQLSLAELKDGLDKAGLLRSNSDLERIMKGVDADGSGHIDYTEFLAATLDRRCYLTEDVCWAAFSVFDVNGDGKISHEELGRLLGSGDIKQVVPSAHVAALLREVDKNGDGMIDFEEFMEAMRGQHEPRAMVL